MSKKNKVLVQISWSDYDLYTKEAIKAGYKVVGIIDSFNPTIRVHKKERTVHISPPPARRENSISNISPREFRAMLKDKVPNNDFVYLPEVQYESSVYLALWVKKGEVCLYSPELKKNVLSETDPFGPATWITGMRRVKRSAIPKKLLSGASFANIKN